MSARKPTGPAAPRRPSPEALRRLITDGQVPAFVLLHGDEAYERERLSAWLVAHLRPAVAPDFNVDVFHGDSLDAVRLLEVYYAYPVLAPRRLVVVRGVDRLPAPQCKALEPLVDNPAETSVVLATGAKIDGRRRLFAQMARQGVALEFRVPFDSRLPDVIRAMGAERKLRLSPEAVDRLRLYVGARICELANELDKLVLYVGDAERVTAAHVEELVGAARGASVFDLTDAVGLADRRRAVALLHALLEQGEEANRIVPLVARHLQLLLRTQRLERVGLPKEEMARQLGVAPFFLSSYRQQARSLPSTALWRGLSALRRTEELLRTGGGRARQRAVMDLCLSALIPSDPRAGG